MVYGWQGGVEYQDLHDDIGDSLRDPRGGPAPVTLRDLPTPYISAIFPMELVPGSAVGHTRVNGATRLVPGTARTRAPIPVFEQEPLSMKLSVAAPLAAGDCIVRDVSWTQSCMDVRWFSRVV